MLPIVENFEGQYLEIYLTCSCKTRSIEFVSLSYISTAIYKKHSKKAVKMAGAIWHQITRKSRADGQFFRFFPQTNANRLLLQILNLVSLQP